MSKREIKITEEKNGSEQDASRVQKNDSMYVDPSALSIPRENTEVSFINKDKRFQGENMVLRTEGLVKQYGQRIVANNVSINVKQGEIVGLLGPNGAGKTTTFYMTTGLIVPNAGRIYLNDVDITKYPVYSITNHL